jgi:serine/threonine protein kinase
VPHPLLDQNTTDQLPAAFLGGLGRVFAEFGRETQGSGNCSYGVEVAGERFFVKTAGDPADPSPYLRFPERVALLENAMRLHASVRHPSLAPLLHVVRSPGGPLLVYPWADGELLAVPRARRDDPASALQRFRRLPPAPIIRALDAVYDLHARLAAAGWVACDFYDGCLIYDFARDRLTVMDLDTYHQGPFTNTMGRMFGSSRFMAPEEFERGARIDERTTVFTLGRAALVLLGDGNLSTEAFGGARALFDAVEKACRPAPAERFGSVAEFVRAWETARGAHER